MDIEETLLNVKRFDDVNQTAKVAKESNAREDECNKFYSKNKRAHSKTLEMQPTVCK